MYMGQSTYTVSFQLACGVAGHHVSDLHHVVASWPTRQGSLSFRLRFCGVWTQLDHWLSSYQGRPRVSGGSRCDYRERLVVEAFTVGT